MEFRNITFEDSGCPGPGQAAEEAASLPQPGEPTVDTVARELADKPMRIRRTAVSPAEEFQLRSGEIQPISDALAACILSCKGRAQVTAKGIRIKREDLGPEFSTRLGGVLFWHVDSLVCSDTTRRESKVFYVLNRRKPDCIHLLDDAGRYIETLPAKEKPAVLDTEAQARALAADKRAIGRVGRRLQDLHGEETWAALEDARHNKDMATRYAQTFDPPGTDPAQAPQPARSPSADRLRDAERALETDRDRAASARDLGRAVAGQRSDPEPAPEPDRVEDWTPRTDRTPQPTHPSTPEQVEQW
jgi:hypothetical protein